MFDIVNINNYSKTNKALLNISFIIVFLLLIGFWSYFVSNINNNRYELLIMFIGVFVILFLSRLFVNNVIEKYKKVGALDFVNESLIVNGKIIEYDSLVKIKIFNYRRVTSNGFLNYKNEILRLELTYRNDKDTIYVNNSSLNLNIIT
jgi:hypothetical protein